MPLAYTTGTATPRTRVPAPACDCHLHVYDSRYPAVAGAALLPPDASVAQYRALQQRLGTRRAVLVTPSTYGNDNRPMLAALQRMGDDARGVAVIDGSESDAQLAALHAAGVRGIRLNLSLGVTNTLDDAERLAERIAPLGWHVQLLMPPDLLARAGERLARLPAPLVFDHLGRIPPRQAFQHPAHALLLALLRDGRAWMKLSGGYIVSETGDASDARLDPLARGYIDAAPGRVVWGSDWPHASASAGRHPMPDDAEQLDRLAHWAGDAATLRRILVTNPERLYGFTPTGPDNTETM
ncbi:dicarboxylic acid hydrolase [Bordetella ansorpii]|uniref:Dicarboxylic acid hydrolase n=1 Tax=Bordetella ansorpii TaxID=288768 RepID=A0A157P588_9BORD|nr:amidohydrolase family protein [Bordetella ansorpii]SAI28456.1 dicarboxylic acid hydrolase [Bordetella ansorpii]